MAIQIVSNLSVAPNPTALPKRIELTQTLVSEEAAEKITVTYALEPGNGLLFKDGDAAPAPTFLRHEKVGKAPQAMVDRVVLQLADGATRPATATIHQAITDASGDTILDSVIVSFKS